MRFFFVVSFIATWLIITLFRFEVWYNLMQLIYVIRLDPQLLERTVRGAPNRLLIYMSKFTPFFLVTFVQWLIGYFAVQKETLAEEDESEGELESSFKVDEDEIASIRGSIPVETPGRLAQVANVETPRQEEKDESDEVKRHSDLIQDEQEGHLETKSHSASSNAQDWISPLQPRRRGEHRSMVVDIGFTR